MISWIVLCPSHALAAHLHRFNIIKQYALVAFGVHLFINLLQLTFGIDHKRSAVPVHRSLVFALADARGIQQFMIRIGQQVDREGKLVAEILVRLDIVGADSDDGDIRVVKFPFGCSE